ncbi:histidinol-phosphate transaminase [Mangrovivirga sp. M17]|uniref:Histidinol-phosphate aminotransferase n=1 Tax=Mangrovivirga halotolerans TaxID=2993936 RepID=A0ABT3RMI9_9BACT|nr:histidinol-phosphate transaminase [Mangrovivirga halotolerans]MCX2742492.1 histidinol-phosphate transaminase [Mangrovivirga halotolerans]
MINIDNLIRTHIKALKPYSSARDEFDGLASVFLDANENPFGSADGNKYNRYPDPLQQTVKGKLGLLKNIDPDKIFLGNGSDEPIDLLFRIFCEPGEDRVIITPPTYGMYKVSADINNVECLEVPLLRNYQLNVETIIDTIEKDKKIKLIFLCSPNNPTGNLMHEKDIEAILKSFGGIVVIDEAYIDFTTSQSWSQRLEEYPNLVVLQTFSKAWGMAGLRLGMAYADPKIIGFLNKVKPPYNINEATQEAASKALDNFKQVDEWVALVIAERKRLIQEIVKLSAVKNVYPSDANFILVKIHKAAELYRSLIKKGIVVRNRSNVVLCDDCLRITIGTKNENDILLSELTALVVDKLNA